MPGASSYQSEMMASALGQKTNIYFPKTSFLTFDAGKHEAIIAKLMDFNEKVPTNYQIEHVEDMTSLMTGSGATKQRMEKLWTILQWPNEYRFPALDTARLAIRHPQINEHLCRDITGFFPHLAETAAPTAPTTNQMLALRILCNAFSQSEGLKKLLELREDIINTALLLQNSTNKNVQIGLATLLLNYSVALTRSNDEARSQCAIAAITVLEAAKEGEALFRLFVAIGTLSANAETRRLCKSMNLTGVLKEFSKRNDLESKVSECAQCLWQELK